MFVLREFIEDVGLMGEEYFLYFEELDWALRGKEKGWELSARDWWMGMVGYGDLWLSIY